MIRYTFEFIELDGGTMKIHMESPPSADFTPKEQLLAVAFAQHCKELLAHIDKEGEGEFKTDFN